MTLSMPEQTEPGPLDGFLGNRAHIKVDMDFSHETGMLDGNRESVWSKSGPEFTPREPSGSDLEGHWACDGIAEYYRFSTVRSVLERARRENSNTETPAACALREPQRIMMAIPFVPRTELLWDGSMLVCHQASRIRASALSDYSWRVPAATTVDQRPGALTDGRGPFYWGFSYAFPDIITGKFARAERTFGKITLGGYATELEVYRIGDPDVNCLQFEVAYDPSIGWLPRFARVIEYRSHVSAIAKDMYLTGTRRCSAGGFVPVDWYTCAFIIENFNERFPNYQAATDLKRERCGSGHFLATTFEDRETPVALVEVEDIQSIDVMGGNIPIPQGFTSFSIPEIKALLSRSLEVSGNTIVP